MTQVNFVVKNNGPKRSGNTVATFTGMETVEVNSHEASKGDYQIDRHAWVIGSLEPSEEVSISLDMVPQEGLPDQVIVARVYGDALELNDGNNQIEFVVSEGGSSGGCDFFLTINPEQGDDWGGHVQFSVRTAAEPVHDDWGGVTLLDNFDGLGEINIPEEYQNAEVSMGGNYDAYNDYYGVYLSAYWYDIAPITDAYLEIFSIRKSSDPLGVTEFSVNGNSKISTERWDSLVDANLCANMMIGRPPFDIYHNKATPYAGLCLSVNTAPEGISFLTDRILEMNEGNSLLGDFKALLRYNRNDSSDNVGSFRTIPVGIDEMYIGYDDTQGSSRWSIAVIIVTSPDAVNDVEVREYPSIELGFNDRGFHSTSYSSYLGWGDSKTITFEMGAEFDDQFGYPESFVIRTNHHGGI